MVLKLKSCTVLRPFVYISPLVAHGASERLSDCANWSNLFQIHHYNGEQRY